ncbi:MAG: efflux transporter outer membrane subunit [Pseudomonadota bacterium]
MPKGRSLRRAAAATLTLAACATPGPKQALEPIEAERTSWAAIANAQGAAAVTDDWLSDLQDPAVTSVVTEALRNNFNLQAAGARVVAARNQARNVRANMLPTIGAGLSANRTGGPRVFSGIDFGDQFQTTFSTGFNLDWELDVWGRLTDATRAAYLDAAAEELDFAAARLSLAGNAATGHYDLTAARLQRQLAERDVETGQANLRIIERRYQRGISTSLDLRLARSSLASSEAALQSRIQQELEAARRLEVVLGRYPDASTQAASALPQLAALTGGDRGPLGSPEELLVRRPDVVAAERRLKSAGLRVNEARKAFLPRLSLSGGITQNAIGPNTTNSVADINDLWDFDQLAKNLVGNLTQPLFQGGRLVATERQRNAQARAALFEYANTALTAWREVEDAIAAERFLSARENALREAFVEAEAAEELTERRYLAGTTNIFDLINAQQRRIQAEGQLIDAKRTRLTNRVDLYLALGAPYILEGELALATADGDEGTPKTSPGGAS